MRKTLQRIIQLISLASFILLIAAGKVQLWLGVFLLSVLAAFLFGRVYCGWICPIQTIMSGIAWVKKKLHIKSLQIPVVLTKPWVRYLALGIFFLLFAFTMVSGKMLPVLPALLAAGAVFTIFYPEELWHRHLCPYGALFSVPASKSKNGLSINPAQCNNCGSCERVCPAKAIERGTEARQITAGECLVCMKCSAACKTNAIKFARRF